MTELLECLAEAVGGVDEVVGELLGALARDARLAGGGLDGLGSGGAHRIAAAGLLLGVLLAVALLGFFLLGHE